ncbi:MAG: hypothetical protein ACKOX7_04340 [Bacteroidota bacterium]
MTRDRLAKLIKHPSSSDQESISALEEIVARFPYYTNGHILLTIQYRLLDHIRYDSQLRKTSVYVPDRAVLRRLVLAEEEVPFPNSVHASEETLVKTESTVEVTTVDEKNKASDIEIVEKRTETQESRPTDAKLDPREVIEQRLKELMQQDQLVRDQLFETTSLESPIIVPIKGGNAADEDYAETESTSTQSTKIETPQEPISPNDHEEIGYIKESAPNPPSVIEVPKEHTSTKKPEETEIAVDQTNPETNTPVPTGEEKHFDSPLDKTQPRSFGDWLKVLPAQGSEASKSDTSKSVTPVALGGDYFGVEPTDSTVHTENTTQEESIIDKFIREEPRIVPSKSEFYSPGNMARKSAQEHEDLISETLARIYAQQGNIAKAITTYERLALKLPQKKAYFASLIENLLSSS